MIRSRWWFFLSLATIFGRSWVFPEISAAQERIEEALLDMDTESSAAGDAVDYLQDLETDPINLHTAPVADFALIPGIGPAVARHIINVRAAGGDLSAPGTLRALAGGNPSTLSSLRRFTRTVRRVFPSVGRVRFRSRIDGVLEQARGYREGVYPGAGIRSYQRILLDMDDRIRTGFLIEKDAGEPRWTDHATGYVEVDGVVPSHRIVVGDYLLEFGQGLSFWRGRSFGKGNAVIFPARRRGRGIRGNRSADETIGYRGVAVEGRRSGFRYTVFGSVRKLDATLNIDGQVTSVFRTGLHRTPTERLKTNILAERLGGGRVEYNSDRYGSAGITAAYTTYDHPFTGHARDIFRFTGKRNSILSGDFDVYLATANLFGEAARSRSGGMGVIGGIAVQHFNTTWVVSARHYTPDFHSPGGHAFGERASENRNEDGIYIGAELPVTNRVTLDMYYDQFTFPWRQYYVPFPADGREWLGGLEYRPDRDTRVRLRGRGAWKRRTGKITNAAGRLSEVLVPETRHTIRLDLERQVHSRVRIRWRLEAVWERTTAEEAEFSALNESAWGLNGYLDARYEPGRTLVMDARLSAFGAPGRNVACYQFENDLPGMLSIRRLSGEGVRTYLRLRYRPVSGLTVTLKFGTERYMNREVLSSGYDAIPGNRRSRIAAQLDWQW